MIVLHVSYIEALVVVSHVSYIEALVLVSHVSYIEASVLVLRVSYIEALVVAIIYYDLTVVIYTETSFVIHPTKCLSDI